MAKKPTYEELEQRVKKLEKEAVERKRAEGESKHQKRRLESLIEYSSLAIVTLDEGHNIISCNRDFERLFHFKESEIVGINLDELIAGQEYIKDATSYTKETLKGKAIHGSGKRKRKDGIYIDVQFTGVPVIIDGKVIGAYGIYQDISERKRVEEETERRVAQLELVYEVAHRVSSELGLKALLSKIVTAVCDTFDYYGVRLLLVDEETERLTMQSILDGYADIFPKDLWLAKGEGMIGYAAATGETQLSGDVTKHPHFVRKAEEETKSELSVPIKIGQKVIGVLDLHSSQLDAFDNTDVVVMETLADQIAVAIKNARLYETVQQELTERKQYEEILQFERQQLLSIFDSINEIIYVTDPNTYEILYANKTLQDTYQKSLVGGICYREFQGLESPCQFCTNEIILKEKDKSYRWEYHNPILDRDYMIVDRLIKWPDGRDVRFELSVDITKRKQAEEALRESEEKYRSLITNIPDITWITDSNGNTTFISPNIEKVYGYTPEEIYKAGDELWLGRIHSDDIDRVKESFERLFTEGTKLDVEYRIQRKDGKWIWLHDRSTGTLEENGVKFADGIFSDITDRKQAEEERDKLQAQLSNAIEMAHLGHWEYDVVNDLFTFNDHFYKIFRTTAKQVGGYTMSSAEYARRFVHPDDMFVVGEETRKAIETTDPHFSRQLEHRMLYADGTVGHITVRFFIVKDVHGRTVKTYGVNQDITEQKNAEKKVEEERNLLRTVIDNVPDYIYVKDVESRYLLSNNAHARFLGRATPEEVIGKPTFELFPQELAAKYRADDQKVIQLGDTILNKEERSVNPKGEMTWNQTTKVPLRNSSGKIVGIVGIARDITEQRRLETQLLQSQKMETIGILAGGVAHDLNNILSGIISYPELLLMDLPEDSPLRKPLLTIKSSGEKAAVVVQDLLTLARRGVTITEIVNLNSIISEQLKSPEYEKLKSFHPNVDTKTNLEKDLLNIKGSTAHLSKTVMNLVSNAAEAMPDGGKVLISTENLYIDRPIRGYDQVAEGDYVVVTVSDTGIGISKEDIERIFEPFYTKKVMRRSGSGLGMSVVWGTVKDHNGYIDVESTKGKGTTFKLYFPVIRQELAIDKSLISIEDYMGKGESILIVDDVEEQREIASVMLKKLGYSVKSVSSGEEAIEYMKDNSVDLLVLDMIMDPGIDGFETYKRILKLHPKQKAIIASGFSETDRVKEAKRLGAGAYVKKPYVLEKIGLVIKEELER